MSSEKSLHWATPTPNPSPQGGGEPARRSARPHGTATRVLAAIGLLVLLATIAIAEPKFPPLTGRVVDEAGLLTGDDRRALEADLGALEAKSTDQLVVYTTRSLQGYPIEDFGYQLGRAWAIGQKDKNNGVLLIVAPNERKVRIEVGRGLEPLLTDAMSNIIINGAILPRFRSGDYAGGIKEGVKGIELVLTGDAAELAERVKGRRDADDPKTDWLVVIFWTIIIVWFIWVTWRSTQRQAYGRRGGPVFIPGPGWGGGSGGGGWSGGSGGGGFSGGGGSFGGGGSSGSW